MSYKSRQNYKDLIDKAPHPTLTRRELLKRIRHSMWVFDPFDWLWLTAL